ncbi:hypothetical protein KKB68_02935, partial [Patescibacteria group bacterium]|nr:hypothetical protein [Patescibacteria group bacterium]
MLIGGQALSQTNKDHSFFRFFNLFFTLYFLVVGVVFIYTPEALAADSSNSFTQTDWYLERPYASKSQLDAKTISGALILDKETTTTFYGSGTLISSPQDLGGVSDFS